jgi:L-threonylcarbamoyladenylate synthase
MIIKLKDIDENLQNEFLNKIFIYPTDTIYGIGCNAEDIILVEKIREIKKRDQKPFSIIAPNFSWILENFEVEKNVLDKYLPGPYTLLLKKKDKNFLNCVSDNDSVGVRIPKHSFTEILQKTQKPIVTTSVNLAGEKPANKIEEVDKEIFSKVDFVVDAGTLSGKPSTLIKDGEVIRR